MGMTLTSADQFIVSVKVIYALSISSINLLIYTLAGRSWARIHASYKKTYEGFLVGEGDEEDKEFIKNMQNMQMWEIAQVQEKTIAMLSKIRDLKSAQNFKRGFVEGVFVSSVLSLFVFGWVVLRYL
jgi:hypothetical protein